jgi:hypothetical protein
MGCKSLVTRYFEGAISRMGTEADLANSPNFLFASALHCLYELAADNSVRVEDFYSFFRGGVDNFGFEVNNRGGYSK